MRLVDRAPHAPGHCVVYPGKTSGPFFDTGNDFQTFPRLRAYVSVAAAEEMARRLDWSAPEDVQALRDQAESLARACEEANERAEKAEQALDAVDGLAKAGFYLKKRQGRPPRQAAYAGERED